MVIEGLFYTKEHEWAKIEADKAIIGITDHAQELLGELVYVELPAVGKQVDAGSELAVVESSKSASDVYSPVKGKVEAVNNELETKPEIINDDCYGQGWICKISVENKDALKDLMDSAAYEEYLKGLE